MQPRKKGTWIFNVIYLGVLCAFIYSWPYMVYMHVGRPMAPATPRERMIVATIGTYLHDLRLSTRVSVRVAVVPAAAGAFSGSAVVFVSPAMLDVAEYSDAEVRFILAHEVGHLQRYDAYRFWTKWRRSWAEARESAADVIGVSLAGCPAMYETIERHREEFLKGHADNDDPHPHPQERLAIACPGGPIMD